MQDVEPRVSRVLTAAAILIIVFFSLLYSSISQWDPDFWWHINTGKYILEQGKLPDEDPFTFTPAGKDIEINISTLKGYWLAQIVLYEVWKTGGVSGIIMLRVVLLTLTLFMVWHLMRQGLPYLRLSGLLLAGTTLFYFTGERPQTFVIPLATLVFVIIRSYLDSRSRAIFLLPLVTLLWTNLHKSSFFAGAVILIYLLVCLATTSKDLARREKILFISVCFLSILMTFASPIGIYKTAELDIFGKNIQSASTIEFLSPFKLFFSYGKLYPSYWLCLIVTIIVFLINMRRIPLNAALVVLATALLSLAGARYMIFFVLAAPLLLGHSQIKLGGYIQKAVLIFALVPLIMNISYFRPFNFSVRETFPFEAVSILKQQGSNRVFAYLEWGGFVGYSVPGAKVFIDGRILGEEPLAQYEATLQGTEAMGQKEWKNNLARYDVDAVIVPFKDFDTGRPIGLIDRLSGDSDWVKAYQDYRQVLFVKKK